MNDNTFESLQMLNTAPEVNLFFLLDNLITATIGETAADYITFNTHFGITIASILMSIILLIALLIQFNTRKYLPWVYWMCVLLISVLGTLFTNDLIESSVVSLPTITSIFGAALVAILFAWYLIKQTIYIRSHFTRKRELFYWATALLSLALGTVAANIVIDGWLISYRVSTFISVGITMLVAIAYYIYRTNILLIF